MCRLQGWHFGTGAFNVAGVHVLFMRKCSCSAALLSRQRRGTAQPCIQPCIDMLYFVSSFQVAAPHCSRLSRIWTVLPQRGYHWGLRSSRQTIEDMGGMNTGFTVLLSFLQPSILAEVPHVVHFHIYIHINTRIKMTILSPVRFC